MRPSECDVEREVSLLNKLLRLFAIITAYSILNSACYVNISIFTTYILKLTISQLPATSDWKGKQLRNMIM